MLTLYARHNDFRIQFFMFLMKIRPGNIRIIKVLIFSYEGITVKDDGKCGRVNGRGREIVKYILWK